MTSDIVEALFSTFETVVGKGNVAFDRKGDLVTDTIDREAHAHLVLRPESSAQIPAVLEICRERQISLYPVSTGRNWGYGGNFPPDENTKIILDLSSLDKIIEFDDETGLVTLEPGVTQGKLAQYLADHKAQFMVPTTGAGPNCSLIGNALERGYGLTPLGDHFQAVLGLEAVLPNGRIYRSPLPSTFNGQQFLGLYKWGCGPYLDGLFAQGSFGVVTKMTLSLARKPEQVEAFYIMLSRDDDLEKAIELTRDLLAASGAPIGGVNIMSKARINAMLPSRGGELLNGEWLVTGAMYGDKVQIDAARKAIKRRFSRLSSKIFFVNRQRLAYANSLVRILGLVGVGAKLGAKLDTLANGLSILEGNPSEFALNLAYRYNGGRSSSSNLHPARDGCGLLWYPPIVPMSSSAVRMYVEMVRDICGRHGFESAITLSSVSPVAFDSTLPLLFKREPDASLKAMNCLRDLIQSGKDMGFHPYRYGSQTMDLATKEPDCFWEIVGNLKRQLDPDRIISPGRYVRSDQDV